MWESDHKEGWEPKVVLERTLENLLDSKEIKQVNPKGNQSWIFLGRTDAEAEVPIFWPPDVKSQLIGKDPDAGKDQRQKEKKATEDETVEWHHQLKGMCLNKLQEIVKDREGWHAAVHEVAKSWRWLSSWTTGNSTALSDTGSAKSRQYLLIDCYSVIRNGMLLFSNWSRIDL